MILKIKQDERFWLYDNIDRAVFNEQVTVTFNELNKSDCKLVALDKSSQELRRSHEEWLEAGSPDEEGLERIEGLRLNRVGVMTRKNEVHVFLFNTEAYLLNDDGKTIEIIR